MPVMDEFKEERAALKNAGLKDKWQYFLDYYKWYVIGGGITILLLCLFIRDVITAKDSALYGVFLNTYAYENEDGTQKSTAITKDMEQLLQVDTDKYQVSIDSSLSIGESSSTDITGYTASEVSYTSEQKLMVYLAAGDVDFIAADSTTFLKYATTETFYDLREILTPEQLSRYEDYLYYVDMQEVRDSDEASLNGSFDSYVAREYDPLDPESCIDPVPIALRIDKCDKINDAYYFREDIVPMGVVINTTHLEETLQFIDYIFE